MENDIKSTILNEARYNIERGNLKKAEVLLKGYLDYNNTDPEISTILAKIYEQRGNLKQAEKILKTKNINYFCVFLELVEIYIKLNQYDKLYILWKENKNRKFQDLKTKREQNDAKYYIRRLQILLKTKGKDIDIPLSLSYKEEQYLNYDYKKALVHIAKRHTSINNKPNENTSSIFFNNYDLEELLLATSRNIDFTKREIKLDYSFSDTYIFNFNKIGRNEYDTKTLNSFRVVTIPNTNKIITMYPFYNKSKLTTCNFTEQDLLAICNPVVHTDRVYKEKTYSISKK